MDYKKLSIKITKGLILLMQKLSATKKPALDRLAQKVNVNENSFVRR